MRVGKQLWATRGLNQTQAEWQSKIRVNLFFLRDDEEGSCWMMMMSENQSSHRSLRKQLTVLENSCSELSISRPTMTTQERGVGGGSHHTPVMWQGRGEVSHRLLNPNREIGSGYPSMSLIVIGLSLPILRHRWCCLLNDVYWLLVGCCIE